MGLGLLVAWLVMVPKGEAGFLSPLVSMINREAKVEEKERLVVGFLPTWMIGKTRLYGEELEQLIFSGIEVKSDGSLVWDVQSKKIDNDNYLALKNNIKKNGGKNLISIKLFTDKNLEILVASSSAKQNLYTEVRNIVEAGGFDGVNVDFEYMSDPVRILDEDFVAMFAEMKAAGWREVNVDVFANTIIKGSAEKIKRLTGVVDGVVVMAYDFHRPGSDFAGAVAPMGAEVGQRSINEIIQKIIDGNLSKDKFIMAYPLYGYAWETDTNLMNSATRVGSYGSTVFYNGGIGFTGVNWDELAQSPWVAWQEKIKKSKVKTLKVGKKIKKVTEYYYVDQWHQAYFENEKSLGIKVEAARQAQLGGIGFWALGYEGKESELIKNLKLKL